MEKISASNPVFRLEDVGDPETKEFLECALEEAYQQTIPDNAELNADEAFAALDRDSNGILNWHDYERLAHIENSSFSVFSRAVLFLEHHRNTDDVVSPNYSCSFLESDWLRDTSLYPDEASIVPYDHLHIQDSPRFAIQFNFHNAGNQYNLGPLRMNYLVDAVLFNDNSVRLELFKNKLDRKNGLAAKTAEITLDEIKQRDSQAAYYITNAIDDSCCYANDTYVMSEELLGYIWQFVKEDGPFEDRTFHYADRGRRVFDYEPLGWVYQIYDIPESASDEELPRYILEQYEGDSLHAVKDLREILLFEVFTYLRRDFHEEELDMIMQSSFPSPFNADARTDEAQLLSMLVKVDILRFIQSDPQLLCLLYQLPRQLRNILMAYIFNDDPKDVSSFDTYKEALIGRMNEALKFAETITPRLNNESHPKDLLIDILVQVREWFPQIDISASALDKIWRWAAGPFEDDVERFWGFYNGVMLLFDTVHYGLSTGRALDIVRDMSSDIPMMVDGDDDGGKIFAEMVDDLNRGGFLVPHIVPRFSISGQWNVVRGRSLREPPYSLLMGRRYYLDMGLGVGYGYEVALHELLHMAHNYGNALNHLNHYDYVLDGKIKRGKLPDWLDEALTEYLAQEEMRRRGLYSGLTPDEATKFTYCDGVITVLSLINTYGQPLEEAFRIAYLSGDYTKVRAILGQDDFRDLMREYDEYGEGALRWANTLGIETGHHDWP